MKSAIITKTADTIRILSAAMVEKSQSGHPGGSMGGADFIATLYAEFLRYDPDDAHWPFRDRVFLDPGHMSPMLYSILMLTGHFSMEELKNFRQWGSPTTGHPELDVTRGIENTSGPLGLGHAMACGAAIAERSMVQRFGDWAAHKTYAYISDGGIQEEISQGVGRIAGHLGLANFIMFYDANDIQLSTETSAVTSEDTAKKYEAWGWRVETINGNDIEQLRGALVAAAAEKSKPTLIIGRTIMGKGAVTESGESFERQASTHGQPLSKAGASFAKTVAALGGDPTNPFTVFPDVTEFMTTVTRRKSDAAKKHRELQALWAHSNPEKAIQLERFLAGTIAPVDFSTIIHKPNVPTRNSSGTVLASLAQSIDGIMVCSADLCNSDKTEDFLKKTTPIGPNNFAGKFLHAGVAELTMAAICNGLALHGIIPVCGTFFVFSDYMKPAVRLAALMGLPVKYVWTHDSFRVGEDGPTHQPIEHEAQIRLLEKMKNLHGERSMLVLRPADSAEVAVAWKTALENTHTPTAFILSRQNMPDLPIAGISRYTDALQSVQGAYIVKDCDGKPDLIMVANGSEVDLILKAGQILTHTKNLNVRIVSAPSEGLFCEQSDDYQQKILPYGTPTLGVSAGLPITLQTLVGPLGKVFGLERFGASAPSTVLDEKFGFTPQRIADEAMIYLDEYHLNLTRLRSW
jgi:transketolase